MWSHSPRVACRVRPQPQPDDPERDHARAGATWHDQLGLCRRHPTARAGRLLPQQR